MKHLTTLASLSALVWSAALPVTAQQGIETIIPRDVTIALVIHGGRYQLDSNALAGLESISMLLAESEEEIVQMIYNPPRWGIASRSDWAVFFDVERQVLGIAWLLQSPQRWLEEVLRFAAIEQLPQEFRPPERLEQRWWLIRKDKPLAIAMPAPHIGLLLYSFVDQSDSTQAGEALLDSTAFFTQPSLATLEAYQALQREFQPHLSMIVNRPMEAPEEGLPKPLKTLYEWYQKFSSWAHLQSELPASATGYRFETGRIRATTYSSLPPDLAVLGHASRPQDVNKRMWRHLPGRQPAMFFSVRIDFHRFGEALEQLLRTKIQSEPAATRIAAELTDLFVNEELLKDLWKGSFALSIEGTQTYWAEEEVTTYDDDFNEIITTQMVEKKLPRVVVAWDYSNEDTWHRLIDILDMQGKLQRHGKTYQLYLSPMLLYLYFRKGVAVLTNDAQLARRKYYPRRQRLHAKLRADVAANSFFFQLDVQTAVDLASEVLRMDLSSFAGQVPLQAIHAYAPAAEHPFFPVKYEWTLANPREDGLIMLLRFLDGVMGAMDDLGGFEKF